MLYQQCAVVGVDKDVITVAVRLPGGELDGRHAVMHTRGTFYGALQCGSLVVSMGVTHVTMTPKGRFGKHDALMCRLHLDHITTWRR